MISGFGESHVHYRDQLDLDRLAYRTAAVLDDFDPATNSYVMDKLVWNYEISNEVLWSPDARFIFLTRDPVSIYRSSARLFGFDETVETAQSWSVEYETRMHELRTLAARIGDHNRTHSIRYDDLVNNTEATLDHLGSFLELETPIDGRYDVPAKLARMKYGDSSGKVRSGRVEPRPAPVENTIDDFFPIDDSCVRAIDISCRRSIEAFV